MKNLVQVLRKLTLATDRRRNPKKVNSLFVFRSECLWLLSGMQSTAEPVDLSAVVTFNFKLQLCVRILILMFSTKATDFRKSREFFVKGRIYQLEPRIDKILVTKQNVLII